MGAIAKLIQNDSRRQHLVDAALAPNILLGMPHLTPFGLSETWLLKELAHRHWLMLGQSMGLDDADFRMPDGGEVYAAICATAVRNADLASLTANDILTIRSSLEPVSRTRMSSVHQLTVDGRAVGEVELISAFVHRADGPRNGGIARVRLPGFEAVAPAFRRSLLAEQSDRLRRADASEAGAHWTAAPVLRQYSFTPSQMQDFNGAGLFYFASYQAVIDRAFEAWFGAPLDIRERETHYLGNIETGETVTVKLLSTEPPCVVIESAIGQPIAYHTANTFRPRN